MKAQETKRKEAEARNTQYAALSTEQKLAKQVGTAKRVRSKLAKKQETA